MMPAIRSAGRRQPFLPGDVPVKYRKRIKELETCLRGKVTDSDTGRRCCVFALNHYAWLPDPDAMRRMDKFLDAEAPWMHDDERERLKSAAFVDM